MHYLYLLYSKKSGEYYVGSTSDIKKRFYSHNTGKNMSTKRGVPWRILYYEAYPTREDALRRERRLKQFGQGLRQLKSRITLVDPS